MFNLEVKKLYKRKFFLIIIIFSAIMSFYNISEVSSPLYISSYIETEENAYIFTDFLPRYKIDELMLDGNISKAEQLEEKVEVYRDLLEERRLLLMEVTEAKSYNAKIDRELVLKSKETLAYFNNIAKEFDIWLTEAQRDSIDWNLKKLNLFIETDTYQADLKYQYNLGRFFRFGLENLFGIVSILLLSFLSLDSLPKEYENGTIITPYTQPYRKYRVIISKFLSFISMSSIYILSVVFFTAFFAKLKGYPLTGFGSISRIITDGFLYMKTYQYLLLAIMSFLLLNLLVYSFIIFIGSVTKNSLKTMAITITSIILLYIVTKSGYLQTSSNPFYLLDYSYIFFGKYEMPFSAFNELIYTKYNAIGYTPYLYTLLPSTIFLTLSILFQNTTRVKKSKYKKTSIKKPIITLYQFELKKIREFSSFAFIILITLIILGTIFSIIMVDDLNMIGKKKGTEGDLALREKIYNTEEIKLKEYEEIAENEDYPFEVREKAKMDAQYQRDTVMKTEATYNIYKNIYQFYDEGETKDFYTELVKIIYSRFDKDIILTSDIYEGETGGISEFALVSSLERLKELKVRNIKPIFQTERQDSYYDKYINSYEESLRSRYNKPLTHSGFYSIFRMHQDYYLSYIFLFFIAMFFSGGYAYDTEVGNQLVFLYTEPIDRRKYHYNKILSSILISVIFLMFFYIIIILLGSITEGLGNFKYPIIQYDKIASNPYKTGEKFEDTYHFINISTYIIKIMIISMFSIGFIASLNTFISIKLKSKNYIVFTSFIIVLAGIFLAGKIEIDIIQMLMPFTYLDSGRVADGSLKIIYNNDSLSMFMGMLVLSLWSIVLTIIGMDLTEKREVK